MRIPETPASVTELDLMKRLEDYAEGRATWATDHSPLGPNARKASRSLHTHIVQIAEKVLAPIMDRVTAREFDTFTMHDRVHGRKVAHLMWHILDKETQSTLTPPEIGMLVLAAHLHDAGMALSREEREVRLAPNSELWERIEASPALKRNLTRLRDVLSTPTISASKRLRVENEIFQAEEALLAIDTRERHALQKRYEEVITQLRSMHLADPTKIPDVEECFSFDGDSFKKKLIDVCVSHNEDADVLVERDHEQFDRPRFPRDYPIGLATVNSHLVAAALRLADILDFDRERTPPTLFHYLVPSSLTHGVNISGLEWNKHLSISNWEIDPAAVVFRGRCKNHIVHHAIVQFCSAIEEEVASTKATFGLVDTSKWPFNLPDVVRADIHEDGYHYVPYQFELDDGRVYELLMGRAIYDNPLVAVRELVQNAVDACNYRDALAKLAEPYFQSDTESRITIRYEEPTDEDKCPILSVADTGTGMDAWLIERWFLKVGRSYYNSTEFARDRAQLRKSKIDFAPVSEFGIGFLSCFLLADRVDVETAMWEPIRGDTRRRHLEIDGPTRLIRIREDANAGLHRLRGTRVSLTLVRGGKGSAANQVVPPQWIEIKKYLAAVCQELPYRLNLEYVRDGKTSSEWIDPKPLRVTLPAIYEDKALRIPIADTQAGLEGEIAIVPYAAVRQLDQAKLQQSPVEVLQNAESDYDEIVPNRWRHLTPHSFPANGSMLLRGGFNVGTVPGIPDGFEVAASARVRMSWRASENKRYFATNLARTGLADQSTIGAKIFEAWMAHLLDNRQSLPEGFMYGLDSERVELYGKTWLERYTALAVYELGRNGWHYALVNPKKGLDVVADWELGKGIAEHYGIYIFGRLLDLVLPRVCPELVLFWQQVYIAPPVPDWRNVLNRCHDFVSKPMRWSRFISYSKEIADRLQHGWTTHHFFNKKFAGRLKEFSDEELSHSCQIFEELLRNRRDRKPTPLNPAGAMLLDRLIDAAGDLEISGLWGVARLDSFRIGRS